MTKTPVQEQTGNFVVDDNGKVTIFGRSGQKKGGMWIIEGQSGELAFSTPPMRVSADIEQALVDTEHAHTVRICTFVALQLALEGKITADILAQNLDKIFLTLQFNEADKQVEIVRDSTMDEPFIILDSDGKTVWKPKPVQAIA